MPDREAVESLVRLLPGLPDDSLESLLVTVDAIVDVSAETLRPATADLLRNAAESCQDAARRDRLLRAADAVAAKQPCALTPNGLTWLQSAAQTMTPEELAKRMADPPPSPPPAESSDPDDEESEDDPYMEEAPPKLPHLRVRYFFPGLVVRVACDFADAQGRAVCTGDLLKVFSVQSEDDGLAVAFLERTVRLAPTVAGHAGIIENANNAWFQPVPTAACLQDLIEVIDRSLSKAEDNDSDKDEDDDSGDDAQAGLIEALREDVGQCQRWLSQFGEPAPPPRCRNGRLAVKLFGRDHPMTQWVPLLFSAIAVCLPDE